jgi:hypothetical protein
MTREDIIRMAQEAGFYVSGDGILQGGDDDAGLEHFAYLVAEAEREACAKICEEASLKNWFAEDCVALIREQNNL